MLHDQSRACVSVCVRIVTSVQNSHLENAQVQVHEPLCILAVCLSTSLTGSSLRMRGCVRVCRGKTLVHTSVLLQNVLKVVSPLWEIECSQVA